jgi:predicted nucleic acid-binding protein
MTRFVLGPDAALTLAARRAEIPSRHRVLAPTLLRSQVLAHLYARVREGALARNEADAQLAHLRRLKIRLLGDRALQQVAWRLAGQLGWADTFVAEYLALTRLQGDALVTEDAELMRAARGVVAFASVRDVLA